MVSKVAVIIAVNGSIVIVGIVIVVVIVIVSIFHYHGLSQNM